MCIKDFLTVVGLDLALKGNWHQLLGKNSWRKTTYPCLVCLFVFVRISMCNKANWVNCTYSVKKWLTAQLFIFLIYFLKINVTRL